MMILGTSAIRERLERGEIFREGTWSPDNVKEASYQLRLAGDGLLIKGEPYRPGTRYPREHIDVDEGDIVVLSTMEEFDLPRDLVGRLGVKFDFTIRGLTPLFGFQVDPGYGANFEHERLYLRVANLGPQPVRLMPGAAIFNIEFHEVTGDVKVGERQSTFDRIVERLPAGPIAGFSYASTVQDILDREVQRLERGFQPVVQFGVFLVASAVIGAVIAILINVSNRDSAQVPEWFQAWGWALLMGLAGLAFAVTILVGVTTIFASVLAAWRRRSSSG